MTTPNEQPVTMWEIKSFSPGPIIPVEVVKQTEKTLWIKRLKTHGIGRGKEFTIEQCRKGSRFHETWEAAHLFLLDAAKREVEHKKRELNSARSKLAEIEKMKPPIA
jgi:hypothetical protein